MKIKIGNKLVGDGEPFYSIAEIGSNFAGPPDDKDETVGTHDRSAEAH